MIYPFNMEVWPDAHPSPARAEPTERLDARTQLAQRLEDVREAEQAVDDAVARVQAAEAALAAHMARAPLELPEWPHVQFCQQSWCHEVTMPESARSHPWAKQVPRLAAAIDKARSDLLAQRLSLISYPVTDWRSLLLPLAMVAELMEDEPEVAALRLRQLRAEVELLAQVEEEVAQPGKDHS